MELYLIRHAQSENNLAYSQNSSARVADPALTPLGERQASLLASYLAERPDPLQRDGRTNYSNQFGFHFTHLICSPMRRALQTAQPLAHALQLPVEVWIDIHETGGIYLDTDTGRAGQPGMTHEEMLATVPGAQLPPEVSATGWWTGDWEDREMRPARAFRVAARLWSLVDGDARVVMVTHGGFSDLLLKVLFRLAVELPTDYFHYNTGISRIELGADGRVRVLYLNRLPHLPPELVSA